MHKTKLKAAFFLLLFLFVVIVGKAALGLIIMISAFALMAVLFARHCGWKSLGGTFGRITR